MNLSDNVKDESLLEEGKKENYEEGMQHRLNAEKQIEQHTPKVLRNDAQSNAAARTESTQNNIINNQLKETNDQHQKEPHTKISAQQAAMAWLGMSKSQDDESQNLKLHNSQVYRNAQGSPYRVKFRKSHTCGSLFANCNCNSIMTAIEGSLDDDQTQFPEEMHAYKTKPIPLKQTRANTLITPPPCLFSISPPSGDVSMSASSLLSTKTTSGVYSLSSAPPSAQLSRDSESFDMNPSTQLATSPTTTTTNLKASVNAVSPSRQSCCEFSHTAARQLVSLQRSNAVTVTITGTDADSQTKLASSETETTKCNRKPKRLFQSYSHPDTDFVFTDENKHPARLQSSESVIKLRSGRVEIKQQKRSSSPNLGQILDIAVHPDIVVTISPRHSPTNLHTPLSATRSIQQRRRLLQRSHEIDSTSSTSESEHSFDIANKPLDAAETRSYTPTRRNSLITSNSDNTNFDAAQKYFAESGILGPINTGSNLIRKTSKILQDSNVIEQIRKTSIILRANIGKKNSTITSPTAPNTNIIQDANQEKAHISENKMDSLEKPVVYSMSPSAGSFTNICDFSPTMPNNNSFNILDDDHGDLIKNLQGEILSLKDVIKSRDNDIAKLRKQIHKLKSVLQQTTNPLPLPLSSSPEQNISKKFENSEKTFTDTDSVACALNSKKVCDEQDTTADANTLVTDKVAVAAELPANADKHKLLQTVLKKQGVSGESCETSKKLSNTLPIPKYDKDFRSKQLIKDAIMDNDFLKNIDASQVRELVDSMYPLSINKGEFVLREGDAGAHLYVSAEGEFEVVKQGAILGTMGPGKAFGELAILYNCTRTASIKVLSDARVWVLDRRVFQRVMMRTGMQRRENSVNFLRSVPLLKNLSDELLAKIADVLEVEFYPAGTYIIRQGANGDTFFLISQGDVKVTQKQTPSGEETEIRTLTRGDYFGEQALLNEDKRTANIIAMSPGVECLTLDRESFTHLISDLCELKEKTYGDENRVLAMKYSEKITEVFGANLKQEFPDMNLDELDVVATLGVGGFGRVVLVKAYRDNRVDIFALKCLKKCHIVDTKQEEHVFSERTIMLSCNSPFICRLYRTFRDTKYVYMLLEACMGGEIWTMLRDRGCFDDNATQFIIGCVLQAFEYLHARGIIYRDLKPENLMLDERGYVKLVDFGFAKYIGNSSKTWTFCGTPEYVAPEIILNKGHDHAVDYWALGILIHELLNGTPPFSANDPMKTYNNILKGIDMIIFPKHMSRSAVMLIKRLCRDVPAERLGYQKGGIQDIKKHKWFLGFDWDGLESQLLIPPFVRPIAHPTDTCYFDKFPCDADEPPDDLSGWDADF